MSGRGAQLAKYTSEVESLKQELATIEQAVPHSEANKKYVFFIYIE
jgi:hypothetical protein